MCHKAPASAGAFGVYTLRVDSPFPRTSHRPAPCRPRLRPPSPKRSACTKPAASPRPPRSTKRRCARIPASPPSSCSSASPCVRSAAPTTRSPLSAQAQTVDPKFAEAFHQSGNPRKPLGRLPGALAALRTAAHLAPAHPACAPRFFKFSSGHFRPPVANITFRPSVSMTGFFASAFAPIASFSRGKIMLSRETFRAFFHRRAARSPASIRRASRPL